MDNMLNLADVRRASLARAGIATALYALALASAAWSSAVFEIALLPGAVAGTAAVWYWHSTSAGGRKKTRGAAWGS